MYEILMQLPLFRGVSYSRISEIIAKTKFHFLKYPAGEVILQPGDPCTHIKFVISGCVRLTTVNEDGRFKISQTLCSPDVLAPQYLFGRRTTYPYLATALDQVGILQIAKADYVRILHADEVFLYNFLNTLSISSQKAVDGVLSITQGSLEERLAYWIVTLTQPTARDIVVGCKLRDLYSIYGVQRSAFVSALERMKSQGLVEYDQNEIRFIDRPGLVDLLANHSE